MSADSQAQGHAEPRSLPATDFKEYEDPARSWIDLVAAFKSGNPDAVRTVLAEAKKSNWTHDLWNEAVTQDSGSEDGDGPTGWGTQQEEFWEE